MKIQKNVALSIGGGFLILVLIGAYFILRPNNAQVVTTIPPSKINTNSGSSTSTGTTSTGITANSSTGSYADLFKDREADKVKDMKEVVEIKQNNSNTGASSTGAVEAVVKYKGREYAGNMKTDFGIFIKNGETFSFIQGLGNEKSDNKPLMVFFTEPFFEYDGVNLYKSKIDKLDLSQTYQMEGSEIQDPTNPSNVVYIIYKVYRNTLRIENEKTLQEYNKLLAKLIETEVDPTKLEKDILELQKKYKLQLEDGKINSNFLPGKK